jgi:hypothetical protein
MIKLTAMEIKLVNAMRDNEYNDAIEGATWTFTAIDNSGIPAKQARGVISSLVQKGLVTAEVGNKNIGDEDNIAFTNAGVALFDNADGEECQWGGPRLLKEIEMGEKEVKVTAPTKIETVETVSEITVKDLAAIMGIDEKAVRRKLRKAGLKRDGRTWSITKTEMEGLK